MAISTGREPLLIVPPPIPPALRYAEGRRTGMGQSLRVCRSAARGGTRPGSGAMANSPRGEVGQVRVRMTGGIPSCPAAAHLECGRIARSRRGGRGRTGDLRPGRLGPTPAEPPRGSANVKIAQGKGNPEGNRGGTGTGQRPKGTNRRTPDEGKPEEGGRRGRTRRANGKPEESPHGKPEDVR